MQIHPFSIPWFHFTPQAVFEGDTGLLAGLSGKVWVDHSTTDYEQVPHFCQQCFNWSGGGVVRFSDSLPSGLGNLTSGGGGLTTLFSRRRRWTLKWSRWEARCWKHQVLSFFFFSFFTFVLLVTGGLEALRKGQMTVFLAGEKVRMFEKSLFSSRLYNLLWISFLSHLSERFDLQPLADEYMPLMESIYCNVIYTGKMGTALIPKVCKK